MKQLFLLLTLLVTSISASAQDIAPVDIMSFKDSCGIVNDTMSVRVTNHAKLPASNYSVAVKITGDTGLTVSQLVLTTLDSGESDTVNFNDMVINSINGGTYYVEVITTFAADTSAVNDTLRDTFNIYPTPYAGDCKSTHYHVNGPSDLNVTFLVDNVDTNYIYEWSLGDGTFDTGDSVTYKYLFMSVYYVELTVINPYGCECIVYDTVTFPTHVNRVYNSDMVKIYPNPNNGVFTLEFDEPGALGDVSIYNSIGMQVYYQQEVTGHVTVDINTLPEGIYSIAVNLSGVVYTYKINIIK